MDITSNPFVNSFAICLVTAIIIFVLLPLVRKLVFCVASWHIDRNAALFYGPAEWWIEEGTTKIEIFCASKWQREYRPWKKKLFHPRPVSGDEWWKTMHRIRINGKWNNPTEGFRYHFFTTDEINALICELLLNDQSTNLQNTRSRGCIPPIGSLMR